jgi:enoyl-[acyl-carrier-protein] reductase (NADH)
MRIATGIRTQLEQCEHLIRAFQSVFLASDDVTPAEYARAYENLQSNGEIRVSLQALAYAQQLAGTGVTVNAIAPGPISTAKGRLSQEQIERIEKLVPIGRFGEASEFAAAVALLASDQGGFFVGATLDMNGGLFMR